MNQPNNMVRMPAPHQQQQQLDSCMVDSSMFGNNNNMCSMPDHDLPSSDPSLSSLMNPSSMMSGNNASQFAQNQPMTPTSGAPMEWQKMHQNWPPMEDGRRRKGPGPLPSVPTSHPSPLSQPSSSLNSPSPSVVASPVNRMPIPPPPYSQGIRPMSSPHPSSPATSSTLPMPSPRMQSPSDASKQFPSGQQRLPHSSPGPATSDSTNIATSSVHSPKPLPPTSTLNVSNDCSVPRTTICTTNVTSNVANPSSLAPISSPSTVKKMSLDPQTPKNNDAGMHRYDESEWNSHEF